MTKRLVTGLLFLILAFVCGSVSAQPTDGENEYRLAEVNPRQTGPDSLDFDAGRGVWVATNPDLDNDGKPEIIVTEYQGGGRVFVFEVVANDAMEFVWASTKLSEFPGGGQTPRSATTGDFDNDGKQEILVPLGYLSAEAAFRGLYFYEWTGNDNDYGTEPIYRLTYEAIDSSFAQRNVGRIENGIIIRDIDGDGKSELVFPPASGGGNLDVANLYILQVDSGTFANGDVAISTEYKYTAMANSTPPYAPRGTDIGDVDGDGLDEIIIAGLGTGATGAGIGFLQIDGPDSYTPGNVLNLSDKDIFLVKAKPLFTTVNDEPVIYVQGYDGSSRELWVINGIVSDQFVGPDNATLLWTDVGYWSAWDLGDQDHPTNSPGDGLDLYIYGGGGTLLDIEYNGTEAVTDTNNYTIYQVADIAQTYDNIDGLFDDVFTFPGMDVDNDGLRDIVVSYKGSGTDSLDGKPFTSRTYNIFMYEWGDSTQSKDLITSVPKPKPFRIIMPDDYKLHQNYPNPFNPTTNITFELPINKTVSLKIYNNLGQEVRTLIDNETYVQGEHTVQWDATDNNGNRVASGVYVYKLIFGNFSKSQKMTLVR